MGSATLAAKPRARKPSPVGGWWGEGLPPTELWPGVTIELPATWQGQRWESPDGQYYFDQAEADRAVAFFPTYLRHHIGEFAGLPFDLMDYQRLLLTLPLFGWKRAVDGLRRFRKVFAFIPKGGGKALAVDTPIPTPTGWVTMGDLQPGDQVLDECGRPCAVLAATDVMHGHQCYRVGFDDGSSIVADADHLWFTEQRRQLGRDRFGIRTTTQILATLRNPNGRYQSANHSIPLTAPLALPVAELPIEPYLLGVWLGDGDSDCARVTVGYADSELLEHIATAGGVTTVQAQRHGSGRYGLALPKPLTCRRNHPEESNASGTHCRACERETDYARRHGLPLPPYQVVGLHQRLSRLGLFTSKHVPPQYLRAAVEQRLALLQGLMDTDGYISPESGKCEFTTTDQALSVGVEELILSLGIKCATHESAAKLYGREVSRRWRTLFHPPHDLPVFRLRRKQKYQLQRHTRRRLSGERRIVDVQLIDSAPVKCIAVDSRSQMYLAGRQMVPTHNSPWGAGTGLYLAFCDLEQGAEVYAVAADKKQARTVHDNARIMIETMIAIEPEFQDVFTVLRDSIECAENHSKYEVLSADASTKHGFRPHGVIFDEMHAQKNRNLYEALKKSMVKRRHPLMIIITHAGHDDEGICHEEYDYAKRVLSGTIADDSCLPVIFEMQSDDDYTDPAVWSRVNPGHGITVKHDAIVQECLEAQNEPRKRNDFLMFHGNRWVNQAVAWIPVDWWDACKSDRPFDDAYLRTLAVGAGLDMSQKWDLTAFVLVFRELLRTADAPVIDVVTDGDAGTIVKKTVDLNYRAYIVPFFWIPENTMRQHEKDDGLPYSEWVRNGLITATEGDIIDYTRIVDDITTKILPRFPLLKQGFIGYDPAFATDIATKLRGIRGMDEKVFEVLQNYTHLSEPSYITEALIKGQRLVHDGNRVLRSHVENAAVKRDDAGRIKPVKSRNLAKRIDGLVAGIMGVKALGNVPFTPRRRAGVIVV